MGVSRTKGEIPIPYSKRKRGSEKGDIKLCSTRVALRVYYRKGERRCDNQMLNLIMNAEMRLFEMGEKPSGHTIACCYHHQTRWRAGYSLRDWKIGRREMCDYLEYPVLKREKEVGKGGRSIETCFWACIAHCACRASIGELG